MAETIRVVNARDLPGGAQASFGNPTIAVKSAESPAEPKKTPKPKKEEPKLAVKEGAGEIDNSPKTVGDIVEMCAFPSFSVDDTENYYYVSQKTYKETDFYLDEESFGKLKTLYTDIKSKFVITEESGDLVNIRTAATTMLVYPKNCLRKTTDYSFEDLANQNALLLSFHFYPRVEEKRKFSEATIKAILERKPWILPSEDYPGANKIQLNKKLVDFIMSKDATAKIKIKLFGSNDISEARPDELVILGRQLNIKPGEYVYLKDFDASRITDIVRRGRLLGTGFKVVSVGPETVQVTTDDASTDEMLNIRNPLPIYQAMKFFTEVPKDWLPSETELVKRLKDINFKKALSKIKDNNDKEVKTLEIMAADHKKNYVETMRQIAGMKNFDPLTQIDKVRQIFNTEIDVTENGAFTATIHKLWFFGLQYTWRVVYDRHDTPFTHLEEVTIPVTGNTYASEYFKRMSNPHPHVSGGGGGWCTGAIYDKIHSAMRAMDIYDCVFITHNFLTQFNPWSPFSQISTIFGNIISDQGIGKRMSPEEKKYVKDLIDILLSLEREFTSKRTAAISNSAETKKLKEEFSFRRKFDEKYKQYMAKREETKDIPAIILPKKLGGAQNE
jgi:hypothetical protein